ncbi:unnamed protein product [Prunus brigantina]
MDGCVALLTSSQVIDWPSKEPPLGLDSFTFSGSRMIRFRMNVFVGFRVLCKSNAINLNMHLHHFAAHHKGLPAAYLYILYIIRQGSNNSHSPVTFVCPKTLIAPVAQETLRPHLPYLDFHCGRILASHASAAFQPHFDIGPGRYFQLHSSCPTASRMPNFFGSIKSIPSDSGQFFEDMKVAMEKDLGKQVFAYFLNAFPNSAQYILGLFFSAYPEEVAKVWVTQPRSGPTYFSNFTWAPVWESTKPFKGWPMGTPLKPDPTATKEAPSKKASSAAGKPDNSSSADGKFDWYHWFKALEPKLKGHWKKIGIYDTLLLCAGSPFPCDRSLIIAALCFWSSSTNFMRLRFGMMTPNLLDLAAMDGLRPHGEDFSAANLPDGKVGLDFHKSNKTFGWVKTYHGHGGDPTDPPSVNGVSYIEHVAFLVMWLCKFLACPKSGGITKEFQALVEEFADGHQVAMGPIFLAYLYRGLREVTTKPMDYHAFGLYGFFNCGSSYIFRN